MGGTMRLGLYPAKLAEGSHRPRGVRRRAVRRGAPPPPLRGQQRLPRRAGGGRPACSPGPSPDGRLVEYVELPARGAPVLRRHPGAPGVALPPDPAAPAVRRPDRGRARGAAARRGVRDRGRPGGGLRRRRPRWRPAPPLRSATMRADLEVVSTETVFNGVVWDVRRDEVDLEDGQTVVREVLVHTGAVGVVALDEQDRVLLVRQYRHPVRHVPLGAAGRAARRRRRGPARRGPSRARRGGAPAGQRLARARRLLQLSRRQHGGVPLLPRAAASRPSPEDDRHVGEGEERDMPVAWVPLDEARDRVLGGHLHNPTAVAGILAAWAAREAGWRTLRPADAPWPERSPGRG